MSSSRTDSYLSLCLEQASHSTQMHHRHGCIIVRGGKVIGQGHNGYKPRFDGGLTLKTGRLVAGASGSPAIVALKQKNKSKSKRSFQGKAPRVLGLTTRESSNPGVGCVANTPPLSQHSEMAAILSALSLSSHTASHGSARSSQWMGKFGSCKLLTRGARELRLRNLEFYVEAICGQQATSSVTTAAMSSGHGRVGKAPVQQSQFETSSSQCSKEGGAGAQRGRGERAHAVSSTEMCCERPQEASVRSSSKPPTKVSCPPPNFRRYRTTTWTECAN